MPVRLTQRDYAIFRLIEEHGVVLEKHISYILCSDQKPSFVRDRLRKLQYLDYVVSTHHDGMLSWWKSPTKPLVYALSPMTRDLIGAGDSVVDLRHFEIQRHLLEVANLRMIFHMDEREGRISDLQWTTIKPSAHGPCGLDAKVLFIWKGKPRSVGIINQSSRKLDNIIRRLNSAVGENSVDMVCLISADPATQQALQEHIAASVGHDPILRDCVALAPHKQLYKLGVVQTSWQGIGMRDTSIFIEGPQLPEDR
ncbi:MAG TPA: hypothetical protein V6D08_05085 [Candidatus Obscuribacterales bacterium]